MKALVYVDRDKIEVQERARPTLQDATDIILRVTTTTICGTDVHVIKGGVPDTPLGTTLGHEAVGVVEEVGAAVRDLKPGDRVLATAMSACGSCRMCEFGFKGQCLRGGWALGHHIDGVQAEYARIPFANNSVYRIPDGLADDQVIFLTDILITAYEVGILRGRVAPGDTVVIVGAGPVGLSAVMTAQLVSPAHLVVVELSEARRRRALEFGATHAVEPADAAELVARLTGGLGADVTIEAAGFPAPLQLATELVRPGGHIANMGVHEVSVAIPMQILWGKQITLTTGIPSGLTIPALLDAIQSGALDVKKLITHRLPFADVMEGYDLFLNASTSGALKILLEA